MFDINLMLMGKKYEIDNSKSIQKLDVKYIPIEQTIRDMAKQFKKLGVAHEA